MPMKLSDAILLGSMLGPQCYGAFVSREQGSCAIGAAMLAIDDRKLIFGERWPLLGTKATCTECGEHTYADVVIVHLNDVHRWTRERIALEFVRPLEEKYDLRGDGASQPILCESRVVPSGEDSGQANVAELETVAK